MRKRLYPLLFLILAPSMAFADRLGALKSNADVLLTTQTVSSSGSSSLVVSTNSVVVSTSIAGLNIVGPLGVRLTSNTTAEITIDSMTAAGLVAISTMNTYMTQSSSTLNDLKINAAAATYLTLSSAAATYPYASLTMSQASSTANDLKINTAAATYLTLSSAPATYFNKASAYVSSINVNSSMITTNNGTAGATPTLGVNSSSGTLYGNMVPVTGFSSNATFYAIVSANGPAQQAGAVNIASGTLAQFNASTVTIGDVNPSALAYNPLRITGNFNSYFQVNIMNRSAGTSASSDFVATNDLGSDTSGYFNCGINSSAYNQSSFSITGSSDSYCYASNRDLSIGTADPGNDAWLRFFTGGTLASNERMYITNTGIVAIPGTQLSIAASTYTWSAGLGGSGQFLQNNNGTITSATPSGSGGSVTVSSGPTFASTNTVTVTNTGTETSIRGAGYGSSTFTANSMYVGQTFHVYLSGLISDDTVTPGTINLKLKIGGSTVAVTGAFTPPANLANSVFELNALITVRTIGATGSVMVNTLMQFKDITGFTTDMQALTNSIPVPIDTTKSVNDVDATITWGTADADNIFTCTNFIVDVFNGNGGGSSSGSGANNLNNYVATNTLSMGANGIINIGTSSSSFSSGGGLVLKSSLTASQGIFIPSNIKTVNYIATSTDTVIFSSAAAITLPAVQTSTHQAIVITKVDPSTAPVIIQTNAAAQLIAGTTQTFRLFAPGQSIELQSDGLFNWWPLGAVARTPPTIGATGLDPNSAAVVTASTTYCHAEYVPDFEGLTGIQINVTAQALQSQIAAYDNFGNVISTSALTTIGTGLIVMNFSSVARLSPGTVWLCFGSGSATTSLARRSTGANDMGACSFAASYPFGPTKVFPGCTHTANDYFMSGVVGGGIGN